MNEFTGRVVGIRDYFARGALEAQAVRVEADGVAFEPGQYMMLSEPGFRLRSDASQLKWTSYSIASSPLDKGLEFVYTVKRTGGFTQYLAERLQAGSVIGLRGPFGNFTLQGNGREKVFIATGAGIAPIMSMIRTLARRGKAGSLFYGFRTGEHFLYRKELESLAGQGALRLETIASRDPSWKDSGYVQQLLEGAALDPGRQEAYLCGSPAMVRDVRQLLARKGFSPEHVRIEQW